MAFANGKWDHSAWACKPTDATRLAELCLHLEDLDNAIGPSGNVNWEGRGRDPRVLQEQYATLLKARDKLQAQVDAAVPASGRVNQLVPLAIRFQGVRT